MTVAGVDVLAIRITYLGELGWELYVPAGQAVDVWDAVLTAGEPHGIRPVGLRALSSLRMEKAYRDYGHDIDNTDDVWGVGLGFAVALDKPGGFTGREATLAARTEGPRTSASSRSSSPTPSRCSSMPSRCCATARSSGTCGRRRTGGRSGRRSGWRSSATVTGR